MRKLGFDNDKYIKLQSECIDKRIKEFGGKLYLEFGGKLFDDHHASRVFPGFQPDSKLKMLLRLKDKAELLIVINANDIEKNKVRGDLGITYDLDVLRLIDAFRSVDLYVGGVVVTRYAKQPDADKFIERLNEMGVRCYRHFTIPGYPSDVDRIVSDEGFGKNEYAETTRNLVIVTAPGPGSGKMATCLSQLYHENKRGVKAGYAKFETFPVWNLPLKHPVNVAYEAATADLNDVNMIDPFHLEAYGKTAVNYNRDVEIFPVLDATFKKIWGKSPYKSPTDMGVNMVGYCINNDEAVRNAADQEIIRRFLSAQCGAKQGIVDPSIVAKQELIMKQLNLSVDDRKVVAAALKRAEQTGAPAAAIELCDGRIVTGKTSSLLGASSAVLLNALKVLAGIDHDIELIPHEVIEPVADLKIQHLKNTNPRLHTDEVLIALTIASTMNDYAEMAMRQLDNLKGCEAHSSVILTQVDEKTFKKLGVNLTCEPRYQTKKLYHAK